MSYLRIDVNICLLFKLGFIFSFFFTLDILQAQNLSQSLERLDPLNSIFQDTAPQISPDGQYLIFQSNRSAIQEGYNLWYTKNKNYKDVRGQSNWTKPQELRFPLEENLYDKKASDFPRNITSINTNDFEGSPFLFFKSSKQASELYLSYGKSYNLMSFDEYDGLNIYRMSRENDSWSSPMKLEMINSKFHDTMPSLNQSGTFLVFASNRPGGYGGFDIWFSFRDTDGNWKEPSNAGAGINTNADEQSPFVLGKYLFFSSNRPGGLGYFDIYLSRKIEANWTKPKNLGRPFNSERDDEEFSTDGNWAYFASDRRFFRNAIEAKQKSDLELYRILLPLDLYSPIEVLFTGQILDGSVSETRGLAADIKITSGAETRLIRSTPFHSQSSKEKNNLQVYLESGKLYRVEITHPGFISKVLELDYRRNLPAGTIDRHIIHLQRIGTELKKEKKEDIHSNLGNKEIERKILAKDKESYCLPRNKKSPKVCLDQVKIYFAVDKSLISSQGLAKVKLIYRILKKYPKLKIHIGGHTDNQYSQSYNQHLSERRAKAILNRLVRWGIAKSRLKIRGYSYLVPAVKGSTPESRRLNRRVEFKIFSHSSN